jgi:hypothetical protein
MNKLEWGVAFASAIGTSHIKANKPCQDVCKCEEVKDKNQKPILIAIASDGAGSSLYSDTGAKMICDTIMEEIKDFLIKGHLVQEITKEIVIEWLKCFLRKIELYAKEIATTHKELACTLLGAVVGTEYSAYFQIGDGAIIISPKQEQDEYSLVFWPSRGEYENTTFFVTDNNCLKEYLMFEVREQSINEVAIITDGIQSIALSYHNRTVFKPFFYPLFTYLRSSSIEGVNKTNFELLNFLSSDKINKRIDDDKTLVLATRRIDLEESW